MNCLLLAACVIPLVAADPAPKDKLQGSWVVTEASRTGQAVLDLVGHRLTIAGDQFTIADREGRVLHRGSYYTVPANTITFINEEGPAKVQVWLGAYCIGNSLVVIDNRIDTNKPRPHITPQPGAGYLQTIYKRIE